MTLPTTYVSEGLPLKGGHVTYDRRLDRIPEFDEQSRDYRVRDFMENTGTKLPTREGLLRAVRTAIKRRRTIDFGPSLDQGSMGRCTGVGAAHAAQATPFRRGPLDLVYATEWYYENQRTDEWPGGEYPGASPVYGGSSVIAAMKTGVKLGHWGAYYWAGAGSQTVMADIVDGIRYVGPGCFGLDWMGSMFQPDSAGVLHIDPDSGVYGGHFITGVDCVYMKPSIKHKYMLYVVMNQSWGPGAGVTYKGETGAVFVPVDGNLEWLMHQQGECSFPTR